MKHDFGKTMVGWGNLEPIQDLFLITKGRHKNLGFTGVNFHLAKVENTSIWQNNLKPRSRVCHINYDDSLIIIRASKFESKLVLGGF